MISTLMLYLKIHALCTPDLNDGARNCHRLRCFAISWGFISRHSEGLLRWSKLSPVPAASPGIGKIHISCLTISCNNVHKGISTFRGGLIFSAFCNLYIFTCKGNAILYDFLDSTVLHICIIVLILNLLQSFVSGCR